MNLNAVKAFYFGRDATNSKAPVITFASRLAITRDNQLVVQFATALCHSKDNFEKAEGRKLALARLNDVECINSVPFRHSSGETLTKWLMENIDLFPNRYRKMNISYAKNNFETSDIF